MTTPRLLDVVLAELRPDDLDALAELLAPRLATQLEQAERRPDTWLDSKGAAAYLGITRSALWKLSAARELPAEQDCAGGKLWFKASDLDTWRRGDRPYMEAQRTAHASKTLPNRPRTVRANQNGTDKRPV